MGRRRGRCGPGCGRPLAAGSQWGGGHRPGAREPPPTLGGASLCSGRFSIVPLTLGSVTCFERPFLWGVRSVPGVSCTWVSIPCTDSGFICTENQLTMHMRPLCELTRSC